MIQGKIFGWFWFNRKCLRVLSYSANVGFETYCHSKTLGDTGISCLPFPPTHFLIVCNFSGRGAENQNLTAGGNTLYICFQVQKLLRSYCLWIYKDIPLF